MPYMIDEPTPFDPLEIWVAFRNQLNDLEPDQPEVIAAKQRADRKIKDLRGG